MLNYQRVHPNIFLYLPVPRGNHALQVTVAGIPRVISQDVELIPKATVTLVVHGTSCFFATKGCNFGGTSASEVAVFSWMCLVQGGIKHHWQEV